jgi:hypothetical protein
MGSVAQFLPWSGTLLPNPNGRLPTSRCIGEPGDCYDTDRETLGYQFEHRFNDAWTVRQNMRWARWRMPAGTVPCALPPPPPRSTARKKVPTRPHWPPCRPCWAAWSPSQRPLLPDH